MILSLLTPLRILQLLDLCALAAEALRCVRYVKAALIMSNKSRVHFPPIATPVRELPALATIKIMKLSMRCSTAAARRAVGSLIILTAVDFGER